MTYEIIDSQQATELKALIADADNIVITAHMSPDGDAMGSTLALARVLENMGKKATVVVPDDVSRQLVFLPGADNVVVFCRNQAKAKAALQSAKLIFCLDYNDVKRIDRMGSSVAEAPAPKVMIDHHLDPGDLCCLVISHPEMSSTCMLLYMVLCDLGLDASIGTAAATCLMAGMMTDTGNFSYNANDPKIYQVLGQLMAKGVDHDELARKLFNIFSESCLKLNGYAISKKMQVWKEYGAALITLTRDELNRYHYTRGDTEGLVNKPLAIPGVVYSAFFREEERYIKISFRSVGDFPVNVICSRYFNGGGHLNAAGGEFYGSMDQAIAVFKSILPENFKNYINK